MRRALEAGPVEAAGTAPSPVAGALLLGGILLGLWGASLLLSVFADGVVAPLVSTTIGAALFSVGSVISYGVTRRHEVLVRSRLEQHFAPVVVRWILGRPSLPKFNRERREITALFTDIENFTAMTHHADAAMLVATLDNYFEGMASIVVAHGGMIDKIVGDAIHVLFNAPNDLEDHPRKAVECAIVLHAWSEIFRRRPEVVAIGFGRTRIGLETGPAIVGDVGIHAKLDYTAYGDAVNLAARLEDANKELGSSICIGPVAASCCDQSLLRPLGEITVRGRNEVIAVFEPWSSDVGATSPAETKRTSAAIPDSLRPPSSLLDRQSSASWHRAPRMRVGLGGAHFAGNLE